MGCPIHGHPAMACEHCEAVYARAFTNAQAAGYAEAVADVVAWLRGQMVSPDDLSDPGLLTQLVMAMNRGAHVGAAKNGGGVMADGPREMSGIEMALFLREVADHVEKAGKVDGIAELRRSRDRLGYATLVENRLKVDVEVVWNVFVKDESKR